MKSFGQTLNLKDDPAVIATYIEHHQRIWPEVAEGLKAIGILNMRIWLLGRRLFMVMDTVDEFDAERDFARYMASGPRITEWQSLMETFQEPVPEARPGEWWAAMDLVFELDEGRGSASPQPPAPSPFRKPAPHRRSDTPAR